MCVLYPPPLLKEVVDMMSRTSKVVMATFLWIGLGSACTDQSCFSDEYCSPNTGSCEPKKNADDHCNVVQKCNGNMDCFDGKCKQVIQPPTYPRSYKDDALMCSSMTAGMRVPVKTVESPKPFVNTYIHATAPAVTGMYQLQGFMWNANGEVALESENLIENLPAAFGITGEVEPWCNNKGIIKTDISVYGVCAYEGPEPENFHYYKVIFYLELGSSCFNQAPGICRLVKVGKAGTPGEGLYRESQDGPATGGALEFRGHEIQLNWDLCPGEDDFQDYVVGTFDTTTGSRY